jgi:hypothetical protein
VAWGRRETPGADFNAGRHRWLFGFWTASCAPASLSLALFRERGSKYLPGRVLRAALQAQRLTHVESLYAPQMGEVKRFRRAPRISIWPGRRGAEGGRPAELVPPGAVARFSFEPSRALGACPACYPVGRSALAAVAEFCVRLRGRSDQPAHESGYTHWFRKVKRFRRGPSRGLASLEPLSLGLHGGCGSRRLDSCRISPTYRGASSAVGCPGRAAAWARRRE